MSTRLATKAYYSVGLVLVLLIILHYIGILKPIERFFRSLTLPPLGALHHLSIKVGDQYHFFRNKEEFFQGYAACMVAQQNSAAMTARLTLLEEENLELRKQLDFIKKHNYKAVSAEIVGKDISSIDQIVIINRGSEAGIVPQAPVISGDGILVGKVIKVQGGSSEVRLINDNQSRIAAAVLNKDRSIGVVEGGFGISLYLKFVSRDEVVGIGEQIVTSGLETTMPRGLLIGTVATIENEPYKPFQQAIITPAVNLGKLTFVSVIISSPSREQ